MNINSFYMYKKTEETDSYLEFTDNEKVVITPTTASIIVDENNNIKVLKATGTRKTVLLYEED